jgi:site-specific DNA recombinase
MGPRRKARAMGRALEAIRLSRYRDKEDPTTSPARQLATTGQWIASHNHESIGRAEDLDESAYKKSPFARPQLGDWLTYRKTEFDIVVWASLDRAVRRMTDMSELASWAKENNKTLAFCSGPSGGALVLDMSSENPVAELIAQVLAFAAQMEAFNDRERALGAREYLRQVRRYAGGWTSFGYSPASLGKGKGFALEPDEYAPIAERMAEDILAGNGPSYVARWLNAENIPTSKDIVRIRTDKEPKGHKWNHTGVQQILRSRAICGITEVNGEVVRGDDGLPIRFAEPIIDDHTWRRVQDALDGISKPLKIQRKDSPWLVGLAECTVCGKPLYSNRQTVKGKTYEYLRCLGVRQGTCHTRNIKRHELEEYVDNEINERVDGKPYIEPRTIEGRNYAAEIATIREAILDIGGKVTLADTLGESADTERAQLAVLKTRLNNLRNMKDEPDRIVYVQTGISTAQHWANLDGRGKHAMLVSHGSKVRAQQTSAGLQAEFDPGTLARPVPTVVSSVPEDGPAMEPSALDSAFGHSGQVN